MANRHSQGLERALGAVVVVLAAQAVDVQGQAGGLREALQAVRDHLAAQVADLLAPQAQLHHAVGPVREVDDGAREGFVEGRVGVPEPCEAGGAAEALREGVPEGEAAVFGGVVVVDFVWETVSGGVFFFFFYFQFSSGGGMGIMYGCMGMYGLGLVGELVLWRSPLHIRARLQPECFAKACSMWSRKPMPVFTLMDCDLLDWLACPSPTAVKSRASVLGGKAPPSRFRASRILVSFVSRANAAHRWLGSSEPMIV